MCTDKNGTTITVGSKVKLALLYNRHHQYKGMTQRKHVFTAKVVKLHEAEGIAVVAIPESVLALAQRYTTLVVGRDIGPRTRYACNKLVCIA